MVKNWLSYLKKADKTKCEKATIVILDTTSSIIEYQYCKEKQCEKSTGSFGYGLYCCRKVDNKTYTRKEKEIDNRDGLD